MHGLFNYDGVFVQTMNRIADAICLSILWLVASLPVFTIGASTTALYYAMNKCVRRGEGGIWKTFWQSFRANFKQATGMWLILLPVYGLLIASCYSAWLMSAADNLPREMFYFLLVVLAFFFAWACFLFPYLARFQNTTKMIFKNCLGIAILNFPMALLHPVYLLISVLSVALFPLMILCAPGIYMVLSCYTLEPVFRKYMSEEDREKEEALLRDLEG